MCENLINGDFLILPLDRFTADEFATFSSLSLDEGETLATDEFVFVHAPGTCLIEDGRGQRYLARIERGEIIGPARMLQVEDMSGMELSDAIRDRAIRQRLTLANIWLAVTLAALCLNLVRLLLLSPALAWTAAAVPALTATLALIFAAWLRRPEIVLGLVRAAMIRRLALRNQLAAFSEARGMFQSPGQNRFLS